MAMQPQRKSDAARRANQIIRRRTMLIMALLGVVTFLLLFGRLYILQILRHDELQAKAVDQQTRSTVISASRGTIYDANHNVLAISATAEQIFISPGEIQAYVESQIEANKKAEEKALEKGTSFTPKRVLDQAYIASGLSRILGIDEAVLMEKMEKTYSMYEVIKKKAEQDVSNEVRRFVNGEIDNLGNEVPEGQRIKLQGVFMRADSKRYYPYGSLAANVIGFVNGENVGGVGLEAGYEDLLSGTTGLTVTAKNAAGSDLLYQYEQYYDAQNGSSMVLTINSDVQFYLQKGIEGMVKKYDAANGATGIIMDVNSGAIVAMASYPTYDPGDYGTVIDEKLQQKLAATIANIEKNQMSYSTEEEYQAALAKAQSDAINTQWRNKCIDSTYEPGSTFKPLTLAAVLEEGIVNMNTTFNCTGSIKVPGWYKPIKCARAGGHGLQTLKEATGNSCNPAFITMGLKMGTDQYYDYLEAFGLMETTGVDMVGEVSGIFASRQNFNTNVVSLASYAFGQTFNVTPLQLIRAQAACINGGYLYTPYVVEQVLDDEGNIIKQHDATPVRQVVSEETSKLVRECLEYVVAEGGGKNGQVAGYRIGGKTGTADKTGTDDVVVSFMCFAPADDPQYIMLLTMDTPSRNTGTLVFGGHMVAPVASTIMADVLPCLGIEPDYSEDELVSVDAAVPHVGGQLATDAVKLLKQEGFSARLVGNGTTVTDQVPAGGAIVPNDAEIILYLGVPKPTHLCTVPDVMGLSAAKANEAMTNAGLIMKVAGVGNTSSSNVRAIGQSVAAGEKLSPGEVVTVQFGDSSVLD